MLGAGPLVRINPDEVHCSDPHFSDEIYAVGGRKRDRSLHQINAAAVSVYLDPSKAFHETSHPLTLLR